MIYWFNDVRQIEVDTAETLVPEPSGSEFEMAIKKLEGTNHQVSVKFHEN
jgi:hypothetical protein